MFLLHLHKYLHYLGPLQHTCDVNLISRGHGNLSLLCISKLQHSYVIANNNMLLGYKRFPAMHMLFLSSCVLCNAHSFLRLLIIYWVNMSVYKFSYCITLPRSDHVLLILLLSTPRYVAVMLHGHKFTGHSSLPLLAQYHNSQDRSIDAEEVVHICPPCESVNTADYSHCTTNYIDICNMIYSRC